LRWAPHRVRLDLLSRFCARALPIDARSAGAHGHQGRHRPPVRLCGVWPEEEDKMVILHLTPWVPLNLVDPIMCLADLARDPLNRLDPCNQIHPKHFCRSNLEFYPFHEHYLPCLGNLSSYSLKSTVNRV
jgi:hypothetical protein